MNWYTTKINYLAQLDNGSIVKKSEQYLVNAMSFTEAEARLQELLEPIVSEYNLDNISKTKLADVVAFDDCDDWYKLKLSYVTLDEDSGKEKRISEFYMMNSDSIMDSCNKMVDYMQGAVTDWEILSVVKTNILEVFNIE